MVVTSEENNIKGLLSGWGLSLTGKPCDTCRTASALLYCKADAAFLCGACDATIHHNTRHERVWICDVCEQAPASVACEADAASLCSACDHDIHSANPLAHRHRRIPITPFVDSPVNTITSRAPPPSSSFLVPDDFDTSVPTQPPTLTTTTIDDDDVDTWLIPNPNSSTYMYNDLDLINLGYNCDNLPEFQQFDTKPNVDHSQTTQSRHNNSSYAFTDSVVPTHCQGNITNNSLHQNNNFSNPSSETSSLFENCFNIDFTQPNKLQKKNHHFYSPSSFNYSNQHSVSSSDIGVVPDNGNSNSMSEVSYTFTRSTAVIEGGGGGSTAMDREARVLRYREKRKNRKFQKTIRYASRKAYAETRPRIKGRFAKRSENNETSDLDFVVDNGYGVVPAF